MHAHLTHVIYTSVATRSFSTAELLDLLARARRHNEQAGLTGMLLHADGNFFQVLEGEAPAIEALYERIQRDPRHTHVTRIIHEPIPGRRFADWSMGLCDVSRAELSHIPGVNDFFLEGRNVAGPDAGRARKLLEAFREGRWRRRLVAGPSPVSASA